MSSQAEIHDPQPTDKELALGTDPIPAKPYYCQEYFELEREAIFKRTWLHIGHFSEIAEPGSYVVRSVDIAKASILIVHGKDGKIRAFHNVCTHRGTQLVSEDGKGRSTFTCPYHAWTYNYQGKLQSAPDFEKFYTNKDNCGLKEVSVDVCAQLIFINLDPSPPQSLREYLQPLADDLEQLPVAKATHFSEYIYEVDANWKLVCDNFQEHYHLRYVHPRSGAPGVGPDNPFGYPLDFEFYGPHRTQTIWSNPQVSLTPTQQLAFMKCFQYAMEDGFTASPQSRKYYALFPNTFVLGSSAQPYSHTIMPISPNRTRGVIQMYWIGEDNSASKRFAREFAIGTVREIHAEDCTMMEAGQRGLESGALDVIHFQSQEVLCRHLFRHVDEKVMRYKQQVDEKGEL